MTTPEAQHPEQWQPFEVLLTPEQTLANPWQCELPAGSLAIGTRKGTRPKEEYKEPQARRPDTNEDRALVQSPRPGLVIITILDTNEHSEAADVSVPHFRAKIPQILGSLDQDAKREAMNLLHIDVHNSLRTELKRESSHTGLRGGLVYLANCFEGNRLSGVHAGDVQAIVIRDGKAIALNEAQHNAFDKAKLENGISARRLGTPTFYPPEGEFVLQEGDIVLLATDGLLGMLEDIQEVASEIARLQVTNPGEILNQLNKVVDKYEKELGDSDDTTIAAYVHGRA